MSLGSKIAKWLPLLPPIVGSAVFIHHNDRFFSNVPFLDEWSQVSLWSSQKSHLLTFSQLWQQHNQNRMLIPNLIYLASVEFIRKPDIFLQYFTNILVIISLIVLCFQITINSNLKKVSEIFRVSLVTITLTTIILSFDEYENLLWSFQDAWTLIFLAIIIAAVTETRENKLKLKRTMFCLEVAIAIMASISSIQGLLVWIIPIYSEIGEFRSTKTERNQKILLASLTLLAAAITTGLYFHNFDLANGMNNSPGNNGLVAVTKYFLELFAAPFSLQVGSTLSFGLGLVIVALSTYISILGILNTDYKLAGSLAAVAIAFAVMTSIGRYHLGIESAASSRYSLYMLLPATSAITAANVASSERRSRATVKTNRSIPKLAVSILAIVISLAMFRSDVKSIPNFNSTYQNRTALIALINKYPNISDASIQSEIYPSAPYVKPLLLLIKNHQL